MIDKRVVIITGATGNLGFVTAKKYASMGDAVVLADIVPEIGAQKERELREQGYEAMFVCTDIGNEGSCRALIEKTVETYGRIDVLCNNAGKLSFNKFFVDMPIEEFRDVLNVNLVGTFILSKLAAGEMLRLGTENGVIINTGSVAGFLPDDCGVVYSASKAAIHNLTSGMARELGEKGIRVVGIAPGCLNGKMRNSSVNPNDYPAIRELQMKNRAIFPEELANVSYFLSTPAASGINGTMVPVDDGYASFKKATSLAD